MNPVVAGYHSPFGHLLPEEEGMDFRRFIFLNIPADLVGTGYHPAYGHLLPMEEGMNGAV